MVWSIKFTKYRENKLIVTTYVQNVRLWLKHKLVGVLAIGQLYYQSATAPRCTTQLWNVCGLPFPVRRSSKPVSCIFLDKFFIPLRFQFLSENFGISHRASYPFDSHMFQIKIVFFSISLKYLPVNLLKFTWQWRHVYVINKKVNSLFRESIYSCFLICKSY